MYFGKASACAIALAVLGCASESPPANTMDNDLAKSIEEFANRKVYDRLTVEVLASIPDSDLEQAVIDYVGVKIAGNYDRERQIVSGLSPGVRALYITWWVEAEVNNGGFNQYYWNSTGEFADYAPASFEYFAAPQHANLMREANTIRAVEAAEIAEYKSLHTLEAFSASYKVSKLGPLDERFYTLSENLSALRIAKIRSSPAEFTGN